MRGGKREEGGVLHSFCGIQLVQVTENDDTIFCCLNFVSIKVIVFIHRFLHLDRTTAVFTRTHTHSHLLTHDHHYG